MLNFILVFLKFPPPKANTPKLPLSCATPELTALEA